MIQRVVAIQLKPAQKNEQARSAIARTALEVLPKATGAQDVQVGFSGDSLTRRSWDMCILVTFETMEDVEVYRTDPIHRAYADELLKPLVERIHVYNFELFAEPGEHGENEGGN